MNTIMTSCSSLVATRNFFTAIWDWGLSLFCCYDFLSFFVQRFLYLPDTSICKLFLNVGKRNILVSIQNIQRNKRQSWTEQNETNKPPFPRIARMKPCERQNAPFFHPWCLWDHNRTITWLLEGILFICGPSLRPSGARVQMMTRDTNKLYARQKSCDYRYY